MTAQPQPRPLTPSSTSFRHSQTFRRAPQSHPLCHIPPRLGHDLERQGLCAPSQAGIACRWRSPAPPSEDFLEERSSQQGQ